MYWLDTALLILLAIGAGLGFFSGLLWQVARVVSLVLALYGTVFFHDAAVSLLENHLLRDADPAIVGGTAYIGLFLILYIGLLLISQILKGILQASGFAWMDRCLGACLGAVKAATILGGICLLSSRLSHPVLQNWMTNSTLAPTLARGVEGALALVPDSYKRELVDRLSHLKASMENE